MKKCIKCGSHAFNLYAEGIDQGGFCDVHYWQGRAHRAEALAQLEQPRHWVGLCWEDLTDDLVRSKFFRQGAAWAEAKLKDRNT